MAEEKDPNRWTVYVHINKLNGKRYVGITSQKPEYRWNYGKAYHQNPHFFAAINKYGWDNFEHEILYSNISREEAIEHEKRLIAEWKTQDREYGYNATAGGEGLTGYKASPEVRRRWGESHIGSKRSEETKRRMAESCRLKDPDVQQKAKESKYKKVSAFTLDGIFIKTFESIISAVAYFGLTNAQRGHISDVCKGNRKSCGGYKWEYA